MRSYFQILCVLQDLQGIATLALPFPADGGSMRDFSPQPTAAAMMLWRG
jgi:hypothetical protein